MASFTEWSNKKKKKSGEDTNESLTSDASGSTSAKGSSFDEWSNAKKKNTLDGWGKSASTLFEETHNYFKTWRSDKDEDGSYSALKQQREDILAQADSWRKQYSDNKEVISYIDSVVFELSKLSGSAKDYYDFYSKFETEDAYKLWVDDQKRYEADKVYDVAAGQKELEALRKERETFLAEQEAARKKAKEDEAWWETILGYLGTTPDTTIPLGGVTGGTDSSPTTKYDKQIAELEEQIERAKYVQGYEGFMANMNAEDYAANSKYVTTRTDVALDDARWGMSGEYIDQSKLFGDYDYDYINKHPDALSAATVNDTSTMAYFLGVDEGFLETMTKEEVGVYNYLYKTQGKESADAFLSYIGSDLQGRRRAQENAKWAAYAEEDPFGSSVFSTLVSPLKGLSYLGQAADMLDDGKMQENAGYNRFSEIPSAIRSQVSTTIEKSGKWGKVGSFAYNTGMSMADFLFTTGVSGGNQALSLAIMGSGAAADATIAAKKRGLEDGEAFALGTIAGLAEVAMEKVSLGAWLDGDMSEGALRYVLKNALSEGGEEAGTSAVNLLADIIISGDKSEWNVAMQAYMDAGKPEQEAFGLVAAEFAAQIGLDALGGMLSGFSIGGGTYVGASTVAGLQYGNIGKDKTAAQNLIADSLELNPDSKYAQAMKTKLDKGKDLSGMQVRNLLDANQTQIMAKVYDSAVDTAKEKLTALGETKDVGKVAELVAKKVTGQELTRAEIRTLVNSFGSKVAKEMETEYKQAESTAKAYEARYKSLTDRVGEEGRFAVSESGETTVRGKEGAVAIAEITKIEDDQVMVKLESGEEVDAGYIDFASGDESLLYSAVSDIERISPAAATTMVQNYDASSGVSVMEYVNGVDEAYTFGRSGYSVTELKAGTFTGALTNEQMMKAYELGKATRDGGQVAKADAIKNMLTAVETETQKAAAEGKEAPKAKKMTITYNAGGGNVVDFDKANLKLTSKQKSAPALAKVFHEMGLGTNFELFASYVNKKGERVFLDENGVEQKAYSGVYRKADGTIRIDLNAYNGRGLTLDVMAHELTHFIQQWSDAKYQALADFLVKTYEKTDMSMHQRVLREQARLERIRGKDVSYDEAFDEVVANAMSKMLADGKVMERLNELKAQDMTLAQKLWEGLKKLLDKFFRAAEKESALFFDADDLMTLKAEFEQMQQMWAEAFVEASDNFQTALTMSESKTLADAGFGFDEDTKSVYSLHFSNAYTEQIQVGKKAFDAEAISLLVAKVTGRSITDARKWVKSEMTIANIVMQNPEFLDFEADNRYEAIKKNSDYPQGTVDLSNLCPKREEFTTMFDMLQKKYPNKLFTAQDVAEMRKILAKNGITVACGACFVEDRRQLIGEIADTYIQMWKEAVKTGKPLQKTNAAGVKSDLLVTKALAKQYGLTAGTKIMATDTYIPNQYDLTTYQGFKLLEKNHPTIAMGFNRYNNSRGQQSARLIEGRAEYNRQILGWSDAKVKTVNNNGGLRIFSFSDFEVVHLLDLVQVIIDCAARGVKIQGYTKIPAFAKLVRNTGVKLNRSLIPKGDYGYHMENGKVVLDYDTTEGININDENFMDESDNPNVGNIVIGINPTQIGAAMLDPFIDYIIPFHSNKSQAILEKLGTGKWDNYKVSQHEKDIATGSASKHNVNIYTEVIAKYNPKNKVEFVEAFLKECKRQGKIPRYAEFLNVDANGNYTYREGYHKLLVDFKMFDRDGNILPQGNITPNLDEAFMKDLLNAEIKKKSSYEFPKEVYKAIEKQFGEQYSSQETDADSKAHPYSYNTLVSKPDMTVTTVDGNVPNNRADVVYQAKQNAAKVGKIDPKTGSVSVHVDDIGADVTLGTDGLKHGLRRTKDAQNDANYIVTLKAGEIIKHSIKINEMTPKKADAKEALVLIGVARNVNGNTYVVRSIVNRFSNALTSIDVLYAINAKKEELAATKSPRFTAEPLSVTSSTISIADLLDLVNQHFPDVLPEDVLKHYGHDTRPEGDIGSNMLYSSQETDNISNRDLLANAFEGIVQNSVEYSMIQEYKDHIKELNKLEDKLHSINDEIYKMRFTAGARDAAKLQKLESEAKEIAKEINKHDKRLLNLEASEPLRNVIERERKKASQKTREHVTQILQNKKERAEQTELRHKIRKAVRDLEKILNRGNKKQNVKEDMKGFVSKALELADYLFTDHISDDDIIRKGIDADLIAASGKAQLVKETEDILTKIYDQADSMTDEEFTRLDAKRKANEVKLRDLLTAQRNRKLNTPVYQLFNDLVIEYSSFANSKQEAVKAAYDPKVEEFLRSYVGAADSDRAKALQNMRVADMTTEELWKLHNAYQMVLHSVRTANKLFVNGKTASIEQMVTQIVTEFGSRQIPDKKMAIALQKLGNKIGWDYEKLYYALDRIGSDAFNELIMNLANSENIVMQDIMEAVEFRDQMVEKYGFNNWDVGKQIDREFLDNTGKKFTMTLGQLMSLYAYSRREGAWDHIEYGGFVFGEAALTNPKPADSYKLSKENCESITSLLTAEQKGYVEDMQKFLSETMGGKGNEVSMLLYGIKMFGEKNYFPIHIAGQFKAQAQESQAKAAEGFQSMSNAGFTHAQNPNAKAPFVLEGFNEVWSDHVNEMSRYHGTVPALEDIRRVMNRSSYSENTAESTSVKVIMENHFGKEALQYFDNLYREANSGAINDKLQKKSKKMLSLFRKNSVAYSLSVLVQQPTSLVRAYAMIDRRHFGFKGVGTITAGVAKAMTSKWNKAYANAYNEMLKYAPGVTMTKEIGGFDTATGGSIRSHLLDTGKSFKQKWKTGTTLEKGKAALDLVDNNALANLPNVADKIAWIEIWNACKRETVAKHKDLKPNSEAFMQAVGERFTEVIRATQVYDSIFAKSPMLKSKNLAVQMLVSFMNEPNTVANMAEKAVRDISTKGNRMQGLRTAHVLVHSIIFTGVLKSLVYAMRDDDEDETYIEKYIESLTGSLMDDFNPLNYIPIARDVWSVAQGYDVERADMAIVSDAIGALNKVIKAATTDREDLTEDELIELDKKVTEASWNLVESLAAFAGIPVKNIRREINALIDHARIAKDNAGKTTSMSTWDSISEAVIGSIPFMSGGKSKTDKLYASITEGDQTYVERIKATYKDEDAYHSAVRKALRENDARIKDAAIAQINGDPSERVRIAKQIIADIGKEYFDDVISAINSEISALTKDDSTESEPKVKGSYKVADFVTEMANGDIGVLDEIRDDIISTSMANGKTKAEAEESFVNGIKSAAKESYFAGSLSDTQAKKLLREYADMDEAEASERVRYWAFQRANPDVDLTEAKVNGYYDYAEPAGISVDVYAKYVRETAGLSTIYDKWGDELVSKREQVLDVIDSLPLTWQQKNALYLAYGYSESTMWDVPW